MRTITFYSYKGGVGRTLVVANVAKYLALLGQRVLALDLDLEAPGLHYKLLSCGPSDEPTITTGLVDYIYAYQATREFASLTPYITAISISEDATVWLLPAGAAPTAAYWQTLTRLDLREFLFDRGGIEFFLELKERITREVEPDFMLIDARTGITEIGGVATTIMADTVVCLILNNRENMQGARAVLRSLRHTPRPPDMRPLEIVTVLSRIPHMEDQREETRLITEVQALLNAPAEQGEDTLAITDLFVLHADVALELNEHVLVGRVGATEKSRLARDYLKLSARLVPHEVIWPKVQGIIDVAKAVVLDDPVGAQRQLENLAYSFNQPDAFKELVKLYTLTCKPADMVLSTAERYLQTAARPDRAWLWSVVSGIVEREVKGETFYKTISLPHISMIGGLWLTETTRGAEIGAAIAEAYARRDDWYQAAGIGLEVITREGGLETVPKVLRYLVMAGRHDEALEMVDKYKSDMRADGAFVTEWARLALGSADGEISHELLSKDVLDRIAQKDPEIAVTLLSRVGQPEEGKNILDGRLVLALNRSAGLRRPGEIPLSAQELYDLSPVYIKHYGEEALRGKLLELLPADADFEDRERMLNLVVHRARLVRFSGRKPPS